MNPPSSSGKNPQPCSRGFSWKYDEDHHIGQYSDENTMLPIHEHYYQSEDDQDNAYEYYYDCNEYEDYETDQETRMEFCESEGTPEDKDADFSEESMEQNRQQQPQYNNSGNDIGRRRRRPVRKVLGKGWEIPTPAVMQRRDRFRQNVKDETRHHRRILPRTTANNNYDYNDRAGVDGTNKPGPITETRPKNVLHLLRDREVFGGGSSNGGIHATAGRLDAGVSGFSIGVPIVTTESEGDTATEHKRRRRRKKRILNQNIANTKQPSHCTAVCAEGSDKTTNKTKATTSNNPVWKSFSHRPTTDELRTYAEQACVTKFESSYLSHLQHDGIVEDPAASNETAGGPMNNNNNNGTVQINAIPNSSSKAVSTISIAFSPDGKTMASTHGDHTVKITCCMTGRLLQTLVGHPRTPWTVKYHPHAGADYNNPKTKRVIIANRTANSGVNNSNSTASKEDSSHQHQQQQPQQQQIVASGCLGHQVRIWDWISGTCLQMIRLEFAIISLSFHPSGSVLAIANGTRLHFWGLPTVTQNEDETQSGEISTTAANGTIRTEGGSSIGGTGGNNNNNSGRITSTTLPSRGMHIEMRHMLRCVHFLPDGKRVIVGGVNPQTQAEIRRHRRLASEGNQEKVPSMSFYLRLWDFDLEAAKGPSSSTSESGRQGAARQGPGDLQATRGGAPLNTASTDNNVNSASSSGNTPQQQAILESTQAAAAAALGSTTRRRRAISNPRCFVPRALLYNDGGFDVSPDGKTLCACAEYWLPEGVGNATDLLHPPEKENDDDFDYDYESSSDDSSSDGEGESRSSDNVNMDDGRCEEANRNQFSHKQSMSKADKDAYVTADSSGGVLSVDAKEFSPTRPQASSSLPSATTPRIRGRQPHQIGSPHLAVGATAETNLSGSATNGLPMPPIPVGITPQTPPPNVNPLNFPLSPPSPPGRRFAGGLSRGTQPPTHHDQLLQQYNRQQAMLNQHRLNQQQQNMQPPQNQRGGSTSTPPSQNRSTTIPAPPGINNRNGRQHRLQTQQSSASGLQKVGNPFATTSRNSRGGVNANTQRGRFVPHVVTISLDTEPYVETTTEEVVVESFIEAVAPNLVSGDAAVATANQQSGSSRIRSTNVAATSNTGKNSTTTTITKITYNIPGRGAAFGATRPHVKERRPRLGQLLSACPLDGAKASAVTCVKFSPCTDFCLIGYGVREPHVEETTGESNDPPVHPPYHPVTAMYKVNNGGTMRHVSTMLSGDDDVNISRFHPDSGYGFVYGTKQGRIRILGPRPWNYYNC